MISRFRNLIWIFPIDQNRINDSYLERFENMVRTLIWNLNGGIESNLITIMYTLERYFIYYLFNIKLISV